MKRPLRWIGLAAIAVAGSATAQVYGVATIAPGTMLHTLGSVIAKVVQDNSKLQPRVQGYGGDAGALDAVNGKNSDFLALEIGETADAYHGRGNWQGKGRPNLRMAMTMFPIMVAPYVRKDSSMQSIADLKGKRVPGGWAQQTGVLQHATAMLANGGISYSDVVSVPVVNAVGKLQPSLPHHPGAVRFFKEAGIWRG